MDMNKSYKSVYEIVIDDAMETWRGDGNMLNPAMKFLGETGEMVDYLAKWMFKPNFQGDKETLTAEIGDGWYYWRVITYYNNITEEDFDNLTPFSSIIENDYSDRTLEESIVELTDSCAAVVGEVLSPYKKEQTPKTILVMGLIRWLESIMFIMNKMGIEFDDMHNYNYNKLRKNNNHGWSPK